jgi:selenocysteine lyase/cysteine desulfurase
MAPHELTTERFSQLPIRLKKALAQLIHASPADIVLANSASYGLHLLANGFPWRSGDEILLVQGDFPSDILPWLALEKRGVSIRYVNPADYLPSPEELEAHLTSSTRLFCTTWVHSFSGKTADIKALGEICRAHGVTFVVNGAQALGNRMVDVSQMAVDALVGVGFKYLCGPYGTGFCWLRPQLLASLEYNQAYWLSTQTSDDLGRAGADVFLPLGPPTSQTYDVFGTANFFNFKPWAAAIEYLLRQGIEEIIAYDQKLISCLIGGLDRKKYKILSQTEGSERSNLIFISHHDPARNEGIYNLLRKSGIGLAYRRGKLRFSPHLYNTTDDINKALTILNAA